MKSMSSTRQELFLFLNLVNKHYFRLVLLSHGAILIVWHHPNATLL